MTLRPTPQPGILKIANYVPGRSSAPEGVKTIKLSANESPLGASPKAIAAFEAVAGALAGYPDGASTQLRTALAEVHGLEAENIVAGAGSDELLHLLAQIYLGEGDEAVMHVHGFMVYPIVIKGAGATPVMAAADDYGASVDGILAAITPRTKMVFLDNPNNPTGTYLPRAELARLHAGLRPDILLVIDSAYAEYATADDYDAGIDLVRAHENVVMVRTFSKVGLAAARVGWLYGPDHIVDALNRLRGPFNVSMGAQAAGAAAARDQEFCAEICAHNKKWRDWLSAQLNSNQLRVLPSQANFIVVVFPKTEGQTAADADAALLRHGLVTRQLTGYGLGHALRISIGDAASMRAVADVLKEFMGASADV